jgi:hypothetical protein
MIGQHRRQSAGKCTGAGAAVDHRSYIQFYRRQYQGFLYADGVIGIVIYIRIFFAPGEVNETTNKQNCI